MHTPVRVGLALVAVGCAAALPALQPGGEVPPAPVLRYDLRPGDRLVYRQVFEQETRSDSVESAVRHEWRNQITVVAQQADSLAVGFQRNRVAAELLSHREMGRDRLAAERVAFAERIARRPAAFVEANLVFRNGWSRLPWSAVREAGGELLPFVRELPALALQPEADGSWRGDDTAGLRFRVVGRKLVEQESCSEIEGRTPEGSVTLRYLLCPASGIVHQLELTGEYATPGVPSVRERLRFELLERHRGESPSGWLQAPDRREGVLAALVALGELAPGVKAESLQPLLEVSDSRVQRRVLALWYRLRLAPPVQVRSLLESPDPRVRALAVRTLEAASAPADPALRARALEDPDSFVRDAARASLRPAVDPAMESLARRVSAGEIDASWRCEPGWSEAALAAQRMPAHPPGDARRHMTAAGFAGRAYVLHVPDDYRGDEPFPLLIVLGGGPGRALAAAQGAHEIVDPTGYLVAYPHAYGYWWDEQPAAAVRALLHELLGALNVDVNRVYLTGFSNGGTGAFLYSTLWPDRLAAAAPLMGAGLSLFPDRPPLVANLTRLPMLFIHGDRDTIIPVGATRDTVAAIRKRDRAAPVEEVILHGRGHDVFLRTDEGRTLAFFRDKRRQPFPRDVTLASREADARSYWIAIAGKQGGVAELDASIEADNTIRIKTKRVTRLRLLLRRELLPAAGPLRVVIDGREAWSGALQDDCRRLQESWRATRDPFLAHGFELALDVPR